MTDDITAYRDQLATERGITDEDRDLLMTGADEDTLLRQANLLEPLLDRTQGNVARNEGKNVAEPSREYTNMREWASDVFSTLD